MRDFQTAALAKGDRGWTSHGRMEGRAGGDGTYDSPHIRYRDLLADAVVIVAFRLDPADEAPTLGEIETALAQPERPLFLGRKPFVPSSPLLPPEFRLDAPTIAKALALGVARLAVGSAPCRAQWPMGEGPEEEARRVTLTDERSWVAGVHGGTRDVWEGFVRGDPS
jgi:CRISPR system Cascade subunit CasD